MWTSPHEVWVDGMTVQEKFSNLFGFFSDSVCVFHSLFCVYIILFIFLPRKLEALGTKSVQKNKVSKMKKLRQRINNGETEVLKPDGNLENR